MTEPFAGPEAKLIRTFKQDGHPAEEWEMFGSPVTIVFHGDVFAWCWNNGPFANESWNSLPGKQAQRCAVYDNIALLTGRTVIGTITSELQNARWARLDAGEAK